MTTLTRLTTSAMITVTGRLLVRLPFRLHGDQHAYSGTVMTPTMTTFVVAVGYVLALLFRIVSVHGRMTRMTERSIGDALSGANIVEHVDNAVAADGADGDGEAYVAVDMVRLQRMTVTQLSWRVRALGDTGLNHAPSTDRAPSRRFGPTSRTARHITVGMKMTSLLI